MVNLVKGQKIDLNKASASGNAGQKFIVGLGWDANAGSGADFDLDGSAFVLNVNGKAESEEDLVYYGALKHYSGAVTHSGDNTTGDAMGDDEQITVDTSKLPNYANKIAFCVTVYDAEKRNQNFGQVSNAYIRIVSAETGEELIRYDLSEDFSIETAVVFGELYNYGGVWKFNAVGCGYNGGLNALCRNFGLD